MEAIRAFILCTFTPDIIKSCLITALLLIVIGFLLYLEDSNLSMDRDFKKRAKAGTAIILSFEQYLAIHEADPERYPLEDDYKLDRLLQDYGSIIHMNRKDYEKLKKYISDQAAAKQNKKAKAACIAELERMRNSLSVLIDEQEKANLETAQQAIAITKRIAQVER